MIALNGGHMFQKGDHVRIVREDDENHGQYGVIYEILPARAHPYHVRPDFWDADMPGIAYTNTELEPLEEAPAVLLQATKTYFSKLTDNICPYCDQPIEKRQQVGRSVYAAPCGCRLYQGKVKDGTTHLS